MEQRNVGKSGLRVSEIGLGCNNFGWTMEAPDSEKIINKALDLGVTLFDTAPVYGATGGESETILGAALGKRRKDAIILTKFGVPVPIAPPYRMNTSRAAILSSIEASLKRMSTDYIDIYMLHWPDWSTPMQETMRTLASLVKAGKVRYIGCSNIPAWRLVEAQWIARSEGLDEFIVSQNDYSLANREADQSLLPALDAYGVSFMPYSPLANGLLTGKYSSKSPPPADSRLGKNMWGLAEKFLSPKNLALADALGAFAKARGHSMLELAYGWLLSKPSICSVIGGATKIEQIEKNVASGGWRLTAEEMADVDKICAEHA